MAEITKENTVTKSANDFKNTNSASNASSDNKKTFNNKKRDGKQGFNRVREENPYTEKVVAINRVTKVTKGGRRFRFGAVVVIGDKKGKVGLGTGKANEVPDAIKKAIKQARRALIDVPISGTTVPHEIVGHFGSGRVLIKPAVKGKGVIAGGPARAVIECAGIGDVYVKSLGSNTPINMIRATLNGLSEMMTPEQILMLRKGIAPAPKPAPKPEAARPEFKRSESKPAPKKETVERDSSAWFAAKPPVEVKKEAPKPAPTPKPVEAKKVEAPKPAPKPVEAKKVEVVEVSKTEQSDAAKFLKEMEKKYADELSAKTQSPAAADLEAKKEAEAKAKEATKKEADAKKEAEKKLAEAKKIQEKAKSETDAKAKAAATKEADKLKAEAEKATATAKKEAEAKKKAEKEATDAAKKVEAAKKINVKELTAEERAKLDGSATIKEKRSDLQKHSNTTRKMAIQNKLSAKLQKANLRDMTKKELIQFMQSVSEEMSKKQ